MSDTPILDAIKRTVALGRSECGLTELRGIVLEDSDYADALSSAAARYHPEDPASYVTHHSNWFDIITANGPLRLYRKGAFAGLLFQLAGPNPPGPKLPEAG